MNEKNQNLAIKDILGLIADANKTLEHDVFVPSINKEIHLKPLNANHSKNIARTTIEGPFAQNQFTVILYNILKEISDPSVSLTHINILDKIFVLLELRNRNIGSDLSIKGFSENEYTDKDGKKYRKETDLEINLNKILSKIKKIKLDFSDKIITQDNYTLTLNYPSVEEEYQFENFIRAKMLKIDQKNPKELETLFNPMYVIALAQYVKSISIGEQQIELASKSVDERLAVIESLSMKASNSIINIIDSFFGKQINKVLTVESEVGGESYSGRIDISPLLFIS
jgi:hypothetical protein